MTAFSTPTFLILNSMSIYHLDFSDVYKTSSKKTKTNRNLLMGETLETLGEECPGLLDAFESIG